MDFKTYVEERTRCADDCLRIVLASTHDHDVVYGKLREYVMHKYLLDEEDMVDDDLAALSARSIRKIAKTSPTEELKDISADCTGTSSASTKKILLIMALCRGLGIKVDAEAFGSVATIQDLADVAIFALKQGDP